VKLLANVTFDTARDLAGLCDSRIGCGGGGCRLSSQACRKAAAGKLECHGATGEVDSIDGRCSSRTTSVNRPKPTSVPCCSLKSPRCRADFGLSICIPAARLSDVPSLDRGRAGVESMREGSGPASLPFRPLGLEDLSNSGEPGLDPFSRLLILRIISWRLIGSCFTIAFDDRGRPV
jgi:hypothetical protein